MHRQSRFSRRTRLSRSLLRLQWALLLLFGFPFPGIAQDDPWKLNFHNVGFAHSTSEPVLARFSPDGHVLAIACRDNTIRLWDLQAGVELRRLVGHKKAPNSLSFSPDGTRIISCSRHEYPMAPFRVWSVATGEMLYEHKALPNNPCAQTVEYHPSGKYFVAEIHQMAASGSSLSWSIDSFDAQTFKPIGRVAPLNYNAFSLQFSDDGERLLTGGGHDTSRGGQILSTKRGTLGKLPRDVRSPVISADGLYVAGLNQNSEVMILAADSVTEVRRLKVPAEQSVVNFSRSLKQVRFSPDSKSVYASSDQYWVKWSLQTGQMQSFGRLAYGSTGRFDISRDGSRLIEVAGFREAILWNLKTGQRLARLYCLPEDEHWAIETTDGYFQHSENVRPGFVSSIRRNTQPAYSEQFRSGLMVARLLSGMALEDAERLPANSHPPTIVINVLATEQEFATIAVTASATTPGAGLKQVDVRIDGRIWRDAPAGEKSPQIVGVVAQTASEAVPVPQPKQQFEIRVPFPPGQNTARIQGFAVDTLGQEATSETYTLKRPTPVSPVSGRLFVLAVGVSEYDNPQLNLQYSHTDAIALAEKLLQQKGKAFGDVQVQVYVNKQATVTNIREGLAWLLRSCTASDVAVILFSGHGIQKERGLYYVTHEANLNGVQYTCLNWETVAETLSRTQARQILFLSDACYAGAFAESDLVPQQELTALLRKTAGVMVFASSRSDEESLELKAWGHGAFVRSLLDGLDGRADLNKDGRITIAELQKSVTDQVIEMTGDRQHPELPDLGRFDPDLVIAKIPR